MQETASPKINITEKNFYASFLQRILALGIDYLVLTLCGWILIASNNDFFLQMGEDGWWLGYLMAGIYFSWSYSRFGRGQTMGKKIVQIEIISFKGGHLDIPSAILRYLVISLVFFYPQITTSFIVQANYNLIYQIICFIAILSIFWGIIIFVSMGSKKRGLHDFMAGSYVTKKNALNVLDEKKIQNLTSQKANNLAAFVSFSLIMLFFIFLFTATIKFASLTKLPYKNFHSIKLSLEQDPDFKGIQLLPDFYTSGGKIGKNLFISTYIAKKDFQDKEKIKELKNKIANLCFEKISSLKDFEKIIISFRTGIDMGLASQKEFKTEKIMIPKK